MRFNFNSGNILKRKTRIYWLLPLYSLFMMGACDSDPKAGPTARLEIFGTEQSNVKIDITADDKTIPAPPPTTQVYPDDITIKATGNQSGKNVASVILTIRSSEVKCYTWSDTTTWGTQPFSQPGNYGLVVLTETGKSGMINYNLKEYAKQFKCPSGYPMFEALVEVWVTVTNFADKKTETPHVKLKMKFDPSQLE